MKKVALFVLIMLLFTSLAYALQRTYRVKNMCVYQDEKYGKPSKELNYESLRTYDIGKNTTTWVKFIYTNDPKKPEYPNAKFTILKQEENWHSSARPKEYLITAIGKYGDSVELITLGESYMVSSRHIGDEIKIFFGERVK